MLELISFYTIKSTMLQFCKYTEGKTEYEIVTSIYKAIVVL